ncbi:MAG: hypothetical protein EA426_12310 [Spirochaetaceae bacterium]|nr:MAG: hypothetical protein EA426_12310 [Spirochaetaceae bacterium]
MAKTATVKNSSRPVTVARNVLIVLGVIDLVRGIMHTFVLNWAAENIARIAPHPDALMLLGVFGNSNLLTGALYLLVALKAREIAGYILGIIPVAYLVGVVGIRLNGVSMQSEFNGKYMMLVYFVVCIVTFVYFIAARRREIER